MQMTRTSPTLDLGGPAPHDFQATVTHFWHVPGGRPTRPKFNLTSLKGLLPIHLNVEVVWLRARKDIGMFEPGLHSISDFANEVRRLQALA